MKKRYVKLGIMFGMVALFMTGCANKGQIQLSKEQEAMVGEYAARTLLRYDADHRSRLVSRERAEERSAILLQKELRRRQEEEAKKKIEENKKDESINNGVETTEETSKESVVFHNTVSNIEEFWGVPDGVEIDYCGQEVCKHYTENLGDAHNLTLDALTGKSLLVLRFDVSNSTPNNCQVDFLDKKSRVQIILNEETVINASTTMLADDFTTYVGTVPAEQTVSLVVIAEIQDGLVEQIETIHMSLKKGEHFWGEQLQ